MIARYDAWVLRRLLTCASLNGELMNVSEPWRAIADLLADLPKEDRLDAWMAYLDNRDDKDEAIMVLAEIDQEGPPPPSEECDSSETSDSAGSCEFPKLAVGQLVRALDRGNFGYVQKDLGDRAVVEFTNPETAKKAKPVLPKSNLANPDGSPLTVTGESGEDWLPIRIGALPPVESFPLDVLPGPARALAEAAAVSIGCPVDFPAAAMLAAASGMIGRSACLLVKPGYFAHASLYLALVGGPSSGKTPALRAALAPVWEIAQQLYEEWRSALDTWKAASIDDQGEEPTLRRLVTSDPTTEALGPILASNPRGLIVAPDEMTKWVMSMDQYRGGKGGDRPFYMSTWNLESICIDRAKHMKEPIVVPHPFLTVAGGMTADMLTALPEGKGRDDGFMTRLLFAAPDRIARVYSEEGIPDGVAEGWSDLAIALWERPMRAVDGRLVPHVVTMASQARHEWADWCHAHYAEQEADDFPDRLEGPWGKLEAYAARLALVLHLMDVATDPTRATDEPPELPKRIIANAARLISYFKSHARRVHSAIGGKADHGGDDVSAMIRWILRSDLAEFSERDINRNFDRFKDDPAALADALRWMTSHGLVRRRESEAKPKPGRKPSPAFDVNPALASSPRFRHFRRNGG